MPPLAKKAVLQSFLLLLFMGVPLFTAAGSLDNQRLWIFLIVFTFLTASITTYLFVKDPALLERRLRMKGGEKNKPQRKIQRFGSLGFVALLITAGLDNRFHWSDISPQLVLAGYAVMMAGFLIFFSVTRENTFASSTIEVDQKQVVITTGPYSVVRHPMYAGIMLILLGAPVAMGSWWALLWFIPMTGVLKARLLHEEIFLSENLEGYKAYCEKTHARLVPGIW